MRQIKFTHSFSELLSRPKDSQLAPSKNCIIDFKIGDISQLSDNTIKTGLIILLEIHPEKYTTVFSLTGEAELIFEQTHFNITEFIQSGAAINLYSEMFMSIYLPLVQKLEELLYNNHGISFGVIEALTKDDIYPMIKSKLGI